MTDKEAMKLALEALEADELDMVIGKDGHMVYRKETAITALKERLAQEKALQALHNENERLGLYKDAYAEQEPVAWRTFDGEGLYFYCSYEDNETYADVWNKRNPNHKGWVEPLYTIPPAQPQRTWVWLTDEDIGDAYVAWDDADGASFADFARAIEAKLKQKNGYAEEKNT